MIILLLGCLNGKNQDTSDMIPLVDLNSWQFKDLDTDPLLEHQPEIIECELSAFRVELEQLEIRTDYCNYAAIVFETQKDIAASTTLEFLILHGGLWAIEDAEAHIAVYLDGELFWEGFPPIPSTSEFFFHEQQIGRDIAKGSELYIHLHNHGVNDWKVGYFKEAN
jgi:hypothetical protein